MPEVREVFEGTRHLFGSVPSPGSSGICPYCLGGVNPGYSTCRGCYLLFIRQRAPKVPVVPMTTALNPSEWYTRLYTYKRGKPREYMPTIAALAYMYLGAHRHHVEEILGGPPAVVSIVPSKRGRTFESQPLARALSMVTPGRYAPHELMRYEGPRTGARRFEYFPDDFEVLYDLEGDRVLLIEDAWVTGATAVSAAGALLDAGAESVLIVPLARVVDENYWPEDHPCRAAVSHPYNVRAWPR